MSKALNSKKQSTRKKSAINRKEFKSAKSKKQSKIDLLSDSITISRHKNNII